MNILYFALLPVSVSVHDECSKLRQRLDEVMDLSGAFRLKALSQLMQQVINESDDYPADPHERSKAVRYAAEVIAISSALEGDGWFDEHAFVERFQPHLESETIANACRAVDALCSPDRFYLATSILGGMTGAIAGASLSSSFGLDGMHSLRIAGLGAILGVAGTTSARRRLRELAHMMHSPTITQEDEEIRQLTLLDIWMEHISD